MSRLLPAVAAGVLLAVVAAAVLLALRPEAAPNAAERAEALARELRCPDCQGLSVADSPTASAVEIARQIDALIADGASDDEVRAHFVARYGDWILLAPSAPLAWILPIALVTLGVAALFAWLWSGRRAAGPPAGAGAGGPSADERRRLHDEAEALDA
jgi:cytochrome c-type biogenesis protein CcmH